MLLIQKISNLISQQISNSELKFKKLEVEEYTNSVTRRIELWCKEY